MKSKRFQFSLRTLLLVTTAVACVLGFLMMLPTGLRLFLMSCLFLGGTSAFFYWSLKVVDQSVQRFWVSRKEQPRQDEYPYSLLAAYQKNEREKSILPPAKGSKVFTSISLAIIAIVLLVTALRLPGVYGVVQTVGEPSELGRFIHSLRVATILLLMATPILCGLHELSRMDKRGPRRIGWMILGIASYFLAMFTFGYFRFFLVD